jgi:hypothetical protein
VAGGGSRLALAMGRTVCAYPIPEAKKAAAIMASVGFDFMTRRMTLHRQL